MNRTTTKKSNRIRRHKRIRSQVSGTATLPRLSVFRSNKFIYGQIIDDEKGVTLAATDSRGSKAKTMVEQAKEAGANLAKAAKAKKIKKVVFDRGGFLFIGKVKAFAEGVREGGLEF